MTDNIRLMFRALKHRNFRLFFAGQSVSLIGTWMQSVAMGWLVYSMTGSAFLLGFVAFSSQIPAFALTPLAGVIADRFDRRRILVMTQTLEMLQAFILAALVISGAVEVWHVIALGVFLGCVSSLDIPVRQAFIVEMIEKREDLSNAIALNSLMFNSARLIGPSIAGILIMAFGEGTCFLVNAVSFFAVIGSLAAMRLPAHKKPHGKANVFEGLKEGFRYAFGFMPIKLILMILSVINLMGVSYAVLMPVFARDMLRGGAGTFGFMTASAGCGALVATILLAARKSVVGLGRMIPSSCAVFSAALIGFAVSSTLWLSLALLAIMGFAFMIGTASCNIILQTITEDDKRGRVMSFYTMAFMGMAPLGSLLAGFLASRFGATNALAASGAVCLIAALIFTGQLPALRCAIHPIYKKMGIIPEVASGLNTVSELSVPPEE
jgi:MFS family permease